MKVGLMMSLVVAMSAAAVATADPAQPSAPNASASPNRPAQIVLASAEPMPADDSPATDAQAPASPPKRPRAARVTTCRCGDPQQ